jgi:hypothetical protein
MGCRCGLGDPADEGANRGALGPEFQGAELRPSGSGIAEPVTADPPNPQVDDRANADCGEARCQPAVLDHDHQDLHGEREEKREHRAYQHPRGDNRPFRPARKPAHSPVCPCGVDFGATLGGDGCQAVAGARYENLDIVVYTSFDILP